MRKFDLAKSFRRDYVKAKKQQKNMVLVDQVMSDLITGKELDAKFFDHPLKGNWVGFRECHVQNDLLLIYKIYEEEGLIRFERLGSHSALFG
jgi:mRNA interferase YafQ